MSGREGIPLGWEVTTIGTIVLDIIGGGTPSRKVSSYFQGNIPWITVKDMKSLRPNDAQEHITEVAIAQSATNLIPANTLSIATRIALGKAIKPSVDYTINQDLKALMLPKKIWTDFILYWIVKNEKTIFGLGSGTTVKGIRLETLRAIPLDLPPYAEQVRIVEKLEELFADLDNGVAELKAAQLKLGQYRQSLLKSAVDGSLSEQWRAEHADSITETGEQLLQRILKERREGWQQQKLAEFKTKGKKPPKDWQQKYPEPVQPDVSELPSLPQGWVWASLDMLGEVVSGVTKGTKRKVVIETREVPYLRVANVQRGYLDLSEIKTIESTEREIEKYTLEPGDILFNEGGDLDKLGRGWVWYGEVEGCIHQNHVFRMRPFTKDLVSEFISHHGNSFGQRWFQTAGKQTTNLASINSTVLKSFPVPVAPVAEQVAILELLNEELSTIDVQKEAVVFSLNRLEAQRKNILKSAFSGELVPQDSNDEPASVLLERIREERVAYAKQKKPQTRKVRA